MNSSSRPQKLYRESNGSRCKDATGNSFRKRFEDRLTNLPCSLKTKILSCLSTKDAVKTSVLSTKWKRSWTSVTSLDFEDNFTTSRYDSDDDVLSKEDFVSFVNRVLLLRDRSCLQKFHMKCNEYYRESDINSWIAAALLCKVKELDLYVQVNGPCLLPSDIFLCEKLVTLDLSIRCQVRIVDPSIRCQVNIPASVCLPVLKRLRLSKVELSSDVSVSNLLSGCPVLEDLGLNRCIGKDVHVLNIISFSLTSLTIDTLPYSDDCQYRIVIDTPALKYLNIMDCEAQGYHVKDLNHLIKAEIDIRGVNEEDEIGGGPNPVTDLLFGISQVQNLILSHEATEVICSSDLVLPTFNNLKYMKLDATIYDDPAYHYDCSYLRLLGHTPCLETLNLRAGLVDEGSLGEYPTAFADVPTCFLSHLKVIKIRGFERRQSEFEMVKYFLENGEVLEKLTIDYESYIDYCEVFKELLMMPRSSAVCRVEV